MPVTINGTTGVSGADGSAATPAIQGGDTNTGVFFPAADTVAVATGGSERVRVDSSGNVGIGTSSPNRRLVVYEGTTAFLALQNSTTGTGQTAGLQLIQDPSASYLWQYSNQPLLFGTNNTERARFSAGGDFLIATTASEGPSRVSVVQTASNHSCYSARHTLGNGESFHRFINTTNSAVIGTITNNGNTATAYNTTSDYRLKEDVQPMTGALARVAALNPVIYKWKATGEAGEGFIAHELQEVVPHCVTGEKDAVDENGNPVYQGIDTSFLVATLTAAIQEQQAIIEQLKADVAALKGQA